MALQGDLKSFALPDVLRLLSGTSKSGRLEVAAPAASGRMTLRKGLIAEASASMAPRAIEPADVLFEFLRLDGGSFVFEEGDITDKGMAADVEITISRAEALMLEWAEIEQVVPSMDAWIALAAEIEGDEAIVSRAMWQTLAAIGGGGNVHDLAAALELTDLAASRRVMELVQADLVTVRAMSGGYAPPAVELDDFEQFEGITIGDPMDDATDDLMGAADPMTQLEDLVVEERPVVMEDREDALLPEPLPGEGVAFEGELLEGTVDGRSFDSIDDLAAEPAPVELVAEAPAEDPGAAFEPFESLASFEEEAAMSAFLGEPGMLEELGDADPFSMTGEADDPDSGTSAEADGPDEAPAAELDAEPEPEVDEERDSLLKFLSSVKP